jgi:transposase InsO family protein
MARGGDREARKRNLLAPRQEPPHRFHTIELDHFRVDILNVRRGRKKPSFLWITAGIDKRTRLVRAVPSRQPSHATVLALMRKMVEPDPEFGIGGIPDVWVWDNGLEFLSDPVTRGALALDSIPIPCEYYAPYQKGTIESFGRTLTFELLSDLPGWTKGPRQRNGQIYLPEGGAMLEEELILHLEERLHEYNTQRPHSSLDGIKGGEQFEVLASIQIRVEGRGLDEAGDTLQRRDRQLRVRAEQPHAPRGRADQAEHHPQRRRLSRAVRAEVAVDVARVYVDVDPTDRREVAVALDESPYLDRGRPAPGAHRPRAAVSATDGATEPSTV